MWNTRSVSLPEWDIYHLAAGNKCRTECSYPSSGPFQSCVPKLNLFKGCSNYIVRWRRERRNCDYLGHQVSKPLIYNAPDISFICLFPTQHAASCGKLNLQSSGILPTCGCMPLQFCLNLEESSRDKWARWHSAQNIYVIRVNMLSA